MGNALTQHSAMPRYREIVAELRRDLATGKWGPGDQLPSMKELAARFRVAPLTARQAVKHLEKMGTVECRQGKGTFVAGSVLKLQSLSVSKDTDDVPRNFGMSQLETMALLETESLPAIKPPEIPDDLQHVAGYQRIYRRFAMDSQPALVCETFIDKATYERATVDFDTQPALPLMMALLGDKIERAAHYMTIDFAGEEIAKALKLSNYSPIARINIVMKNSDDEAVYVTRLIFPAEAVRVEFHNW